jgi:hypothetical protein
MIEKIENLNSDDVVCVDDNDGYNSPIDQIQRHFSIDRLFEFKEIVNAVSRIIGLSNEAMELFKEGIPCRVMTTQQKGWRLGKIRLKLELQFIPDESITEEIVEHFDSPLDEIRKASKL